MSSSKATAAVAAGHGVTAQAAADMLRAGGTAVDAVAAGLFASCAAEPVLADLGGGGFLLVREPGGEALLYDAFVHTPRRRRPPAELDFYPITADFGTEQQVFHIGAGSIATPGIVRGVFEAHRAHGRLPMTEVVAPAVSAARRGVAVNALQAEIFAIVQPIYLATASARAVFESRERAGRVMGEGERLVQPALADLMEALAREGDDLFYRGEVAAAIAALCAEQGGLLDREDLAGYRVRIRSPLRVGYRGGELLMNPPPASGGLLIAFALALLEAAGPAGTFGSAEHLRRLARVMALTNRARIEAAGRAGPGHIAEERLLDPALLARYRAELQGARAAPRGTTHISVLDGEGRLAALSVSNGEGCGTILPGTGVMLNNMLGEEDLSPGGFHRWMPDRRLTSMMSPTVVLAPDGRRVATGSGGSNRIRTAILQLLVNLLDFGLDLEEAVRRPRLHVEDRVLSVEGGFAPGPVGALVGDWPEHRLWSGLSLFFGGAHSVGSGPRGVEAAGDPRRGGVGIVL